MRITTSALTGIAAVGLLAGCSSQSSSTATAPTAGSSPSAISATGLASSGAAAGGSGNATACPPASTVSADLGISGLTTQTNKAASSQGHTGFTCLYSAGANFVSVTLVNGISSSFLSSAAQKAASTAGAVKSLPGFADQAYTFSVTGAGVTENELIARKGTLEAVVASSATLAKEETLDQSIFTQAGA